MKFFTSVLAAVMVLGIELTPDNWHEETKGRTVFIKFFAPWCDHCKQMAPDWEQLTKAFENSVSTLIAEVDCEEKGAELCKEMGVENYPTLKYGHPSNLQDYEGGLQYDELLMFASKEVGPVCGPKSSELCDAGQKVKIKKLQAEGIVKLEKDIDETEKRISDAEMRFNDKLMKIHEETESAYSKLLKEKEDSLKVFKKHDIRMMKLVLAHLYYPEEEHEVINRYT